MPPLTKLYKAISAKFNKLMFKLTRARNQAILFAAASGVSIVVTYFAIAGSHATVDPEQSHVIALIIIDTILLLALAAVIAKHIFKLIIQRRKGIRGSRLQTRIVVMFSLVAMVPTIIMVISSAVFFNYGIQSWFNHKVEDAINGSVEIAKSYLEEHKEVIRADVIGMANDINRDALNLRKDPGSFSQKLSFIAVIRKIPEAIVFQKSSYGKINILAATNLSFSLQIELEDFPEGIIARAENGELVAITSDSDDRVIAITKLDNFFDTYLLVGRFVDNKIINYIETTQGAATEYNMLRRNISKIQIKFFIAFIIVSLILLLTTAWIGFLFAIYLVKPISALLEVTEKVKKGDLAARVKEGHANDEMATLSRAFNRMTEQLGRQREELMAAQRRVAWSDVARRIAHEIKNPLTPIQLAVDRLKRIYPANSEDNEKFERYINTISRNVTSIGTMVDEFASFARIPAPVFSNNNICEIVEDIIFARDGLIEGIKFEKKIAKTPIMVNSDAGQITQVLTNIIKNSEESILDKKSADNEFKGIIKVTVSKIMNKCAISIHDNGKGFPVEIQERITEPYITTKSKGTGLGLAIVKKIVEDHGGLVEFKNVSGGACVYLSFPLQQK